MKEKNHPREAYIKISKELVKTKNLDEYTEVIFRNTPKTKDDLRAREILHNIKNKEEYFKICKRISSEFLVKDKSEISVEMRGENNATLSWQSSEGVKNSVDMVLEKGVWKLK